MSDPSTHTQPDTLCYTRCAVPTPLSLAIQSGWIDSEFAPDCIAIQSLAESAKDFLFEYGFLKQDFNIMDWVDHAPLDTLKAPVLSLHR